MKQLTSEEINAVLPAKEFEQLQTGMTKAASVWMTSLIRNADADINQQSIMAAVNEYYYQTLDTVLQKAKYTKAEDSKVLKRVMYVIGAKDAQILDFLKDATISNFLKSIKNTYSKDIGKIYTYTTSRSTTPIVSIINNDIYINAKFLTTLSQQSILRAIEMELTTKRFIGKLDEVLGKGILLRRLSCEISSGKPAGVLLQISERLLCGSGRKEQPQKPHAFADLHPGAVPSDQGRA
jgi:hypothetical protein